MYNKTPRIGSQALRKGIWNSSENFSHVRLRTLAFVLAVFRLHFLWKSANFAPHARKKYNNCTTHNTAFKQE